MIGSKKIVCVIPARLKSSRFPRKMLSSFGGKPLLQWVWERASQVPFFDDLAFAIDSLETANLIDSFGGKWVMTEESCASGTDRLVEVYTHKKMTGDIWVNWQGDEPFICKEMIEDLLQTCQQEGPDIWTLKKKITLEEEITGIHFAKVVCDHKDYALYFSRSAIPCYRDPTPFFKKNIYKHVGLYAYTERALAAISTLSPCELEMAEMLEQLRFLYHGLKICVHETHYEAFGIDLPEHLAKAESLIKSGYIN